MNREPILEVANHFQFLEISSNYKEQGGDMNRVLFSVILIAPCLISDLEAVCIKQKEIAIVNLTDQVIIIELRSRDHEGSQL